MTKSPYGEKEVRALVNYKEVDEPSDIYTQAVHINWIDSIPVSYTHLENADSVVTNSNAIPVIIFTDQKHYGIGPCRGGHQGACDTSYRCV